MRGLNLVSNELSADLITCSNATILQIRLFTLPHDKILASVLRLILVLEVEQSLLVFSYS